MPTTAEAFNIIVEAYKQLHGDVPNDRQVTIIAGIAHHETGFGMFKPFPGTFNWGAVQCKAVQDSQGNCPPGCHPAFDTSPKDDGTSVKYGACFKVYDDDVAGARDLIANLTKGARQKAVAPALEAGDIWGVAVGMYKTKYYEGFGKTPYDRIKSYAKAIDGNARVNAEKMGMQYDLVLTIPDAADFSLDGPASGGSSGAPGVGGMLQPGTGEAPGGSGVAGGGLILAGAALFAWLLSKLRGGGSRS
jgi:hypothetical protein